MNHTNRHRIVALVVTGLAVLMPALVVIDSDPAAAAVPTWATDGANAAVDACIDVPRSIISNGSTATAGVLGWGWKHRGTIQSGPNAGKPYFVREYIGTSKAAQQANALHIIEAVGKSAGAGAVAGTGTAVAVHGSTAPVAALPAGATATAGGTAASAATVGLAAVTAVTAFCGTINVLNWVFGKPEAEPYAGGPNNYTSTGPQPCSQLGNAPAFAQPGDYCIAATWSNPVPASPARSLFVTEVSPTGESAINLRHRQANGTLSPLNQRGAGTPLAGGATSGVVVVPCVDVHAGCGIHVRSNTEASGWRLGFGIQVPTSGSDPGVIWEPATGSLDNVTRRGQYVRVRGTTTCRTPGGTTWAASSTSDPFFTGGEENVRGFNPPPCPTGYAATDVVVNRERRVHQTGGAGIVEWENTEIVLNWSLPNETRNNPAALACLVPGNSCAIEDDPADEDRVIVGGPGGLSVPKDQPSTRDDAQREVDETNWSETEPDPVPDPTEHPQPNPSTGTGDGTGAHPESGGAPGTSNTAEGQSCWPSGWGWLNPVEWVLHPIMCAFWDQGSADEMGELWGDTGQPWVDAVTGTIAGIELTSAVGPCLPEFQGHTICTGEIFGFVLPTALTVLVTGWLLVLLVFEVVGFFARATGAAGGGEAT